MKKLKTRDFKVGNIVILINRYGLSASLGAIAKVTSITKDFVRVKWLNGLANNQPDGGYYPWIFNILKKEDNIK